jgi:ectoine hydroxylase-related dioxygenase (phytanoyl-CoA dioxygenase family)
MPDLEQLKRGYDSRGYIKLPSPFSSSEISDWRKEADRLWSRPDILDPDNVRVDWRSTIHGEKVPERLDPVTDISPLFSSLSRDQRILSVVNFLLGEEAILFKDKLIIKPPDVKGYPLHQDFAYIDFLGFEGSQQLAVCIAIDAAEREAGPVELFAGYHHHRLPSPKDRPGEVDESQLRESRGEVLALAAGELIIFNSLCPHRSEPNRTRSNRRLLFFTYNAASTGDLYETYYRLGKP